MATARAITTVLMDIVTVGVLCAATVLLFFNYRSRPSGTGEVVTDFPPGSVLQLNDLPTIGNSKTGLILIEFSDFECPFCKRYATGVFGAIKREFVDSGLLNYAFANHPLSAVHPLARVLASAAICAGRQGRFWEMYTRLYATHVEGPEDIAFIASDIGLRSDIFVDCLQDKAVGMAIDRDVAVAAKLGLDGTPAFVLGNVDGSGRITVLRSIHGAQSFALFRRSIEDIVHK